MQPPSSTLFIADPVDVMSRIDNEQFDLIFLDPPFFNSFLSDLNNPQNPPHHNFDDYLLYILSIFIQSHRILKQSGAILLRISPSSPLNARLFLDRIFGKHNFRAEIIWQNRPIKRNSKSGLFVNFESILFYSKSDTFVFNEPLKELTDKEMKLQYRHYDDKGYYKLWSLTDSIDRPGQNFLWNGIKPPKSSSWKYSEKQLNEFLLNNEIEKSGKSFKRKVYLSSNKAYAPLGYVWDEPAEINIAKEQIDQRLLRLIQMSSNQGSFILDPFISPKSYATLTESDRYWTGVSQFDFAGKKRSSNYWDIINLVDREDIQTIEIVNNSEIPRNLRRLVETEARTVVSQTLIENSGQKYAFLVGINRYKDGIGNLNFCINDVVELGQTLESLNYQVKIIHDQMGDNDLIPLKSNIETELSSWAQNLAPEDTLLVHFSCHGTLSNERAVIITSDTRVQRLPTTSLPVDEVIQIMKNGRAGKLVLSLDVCHAGIEMGRGLIDDGFIQNVYDRAEGFVLLAASTAQQEAYELQGFSHGLYTYYLLQGLQGDADYDDDGRITADDIRNYITDQIRRWNVNNGGRQEPTYRSEGIGEITLVHPGTNA